MKHPVLYIAIDRNEGTADVGHIDVEVPDTSCKGCLNLWSVVTDHSDAAEPCAYDEVGAL